ncbi:hypothetical protein HK102_008755 [Quaeritorhiza haematococci]|nr:hypothetical protein HK102_008755 [Quaeritorhiza haematococci]
MSISPRGRHVVLAAKKGLYIIDLENPSQPPRFLKHLSKWEVADVQWNPHKSRENWVASTVGFVEISVFKSLVEINFSDLIFNFDFGFPATIYTALVKPKSPGLEPCAFFCRLNDWHRNIEHLAFIGDINVAC